MLNDRIWKRLLVGTVVAIVISMSYFWIHQYLLRSATVVLVIRHAERDDTQICGPPLLGPPLSEAGLTRAQDLTRVSETAEVAAIYASEYCRTQQTVQPLAGRLSLPVTAVNQHSSSGVPDVGALIAQVRSNNTGQVVLIAGHTETMPLIIEELGGGTITINPNEFNNLFVVTVPVLGRTSVVRLRYGAPSP